MGTIKAKTIKLSDPRPSAFIDLPPGVHTIGDKKYTVIEIIENPGEECEYKRNVIDLMEPITPAAPAAE